MSEASLSGAPPRIEIGGEAASQRKLAFQDVSAALAIWPLWIRLAWIDIVQRYRGSMLGPFWLTISSGAFLLGLGPLYALLFKVDLANYLPYLAAGFITWNFIVASITESCNTFIAATYMMKQIRLPLTTYILHMMTRQIIIFAHSIPLYLIIHVWFGRPWDLGMLWVLPGFALLSAVLACLSLIFATISVRFRDLIPVVQSVMQVAFFITPIIWHVGDRPALQLVAALNPLAALIGLVRDPLLGTQMPLAHLAWAIGGLFALMAIAFFMLVRYRRRVVYWV